MAACGGGDDDSSDGTTAPSDADVLVRAVDPLSWDKKDYAASAGEVTIEVDNESSQPHDLRVVDPSGTQLPLDLSIPSKGDSDSGTLTLTPGAYTLICTIPGHSNMKATLTVS
jgi:plastocyanin